MRAGSLGCPAEALAKAGDPLPLAPPHLERAHAKNPPRYPSAVNQGESFATAFNARDLNALKACLADHATAQVIGAPFPEEVGRDTIAQTSLPYLLEESRKLRAVTVEHPAVSVLLLDEQDRLDVAIHLEADSDVITLLHYYTMPNTPDRMTAIAAECGYEPAPA